MEVKAIGKSIANRTKDLLGVLEEVKSQEATRRRVICSTCDVLEDGWCLKERGGCGCYMNNKVFCMECECPLPEPKWADFV